MPLASPSRRFLGWAFPCVLLAGIFYFFEVRIERWPLEVSGFPAFRDFANLWGGSVAALDHDFHRLFDEASFAVDLGRRLGVPPPHLIWSYPPTALLPVATLGLLPYGAAVALWLAAGFVAYVIAAGIRIVPRKDLAPWLGAIALCPGVFLCFAYGQTAFLTSAALIAGLTRAQSRPVLASVCLACLAGKPQVALMVPIALVATGAWRTLWLTAIFVAVYAGMTLLAFGWEPWRLFLEVTLPQQLQIMTMPRFNAGLMISPYFMFRGLGISNSVSSALQVAITIATAGGLVVAVRCERDSNIRLLMTACAVLVASAYMRLYELPLLVAAAARICTSEKTCNELGSRWLNAVLASATGAPLFAWMVAAFFGVNFEPLIPFALLAALGLRAWRRRAGLAMPLYRASPIPTLS